jgi:polyisoprenoid-binding protein YceI
MYIQKRLVLESNFRRTILKHLTTILFISLTLSLTNCQKPPEAPKANAAESNQVTEPKGTSISLNLEKSIIKWIGTKVTGKHNGTIKISEGSITVDGSNITGGKFVIDMASISNEDLKDAEKRGKLEGHLKSEDFFDVAKFPTAKFEITSVTAPDVDGATNITGNLEIKGITKSITFPAKITFDANKKPVSATANFNIDRTQWNVIYKGMANDIISNDINLDLNLSTM